MARHLLVLLIFSALLQPVYAQAIRGRVTDAETGAPLEDAAVYLPDRQLGTVSGPDGRYRIDDLQPGTVRVVFSFLGFRNETRVVRLSGSDLTLDVALAPTAVEATPITVTARAQAADILSTPQAVSVIEGARLDARRGAAAFDALEGTAGVRLLRTGVAVAKPVIRGLTGQRVLVVQDGVRQEGQQWGEEHGPELDAFGMDRIEVLKGPASLLYGSDALGGVVQASSHDLFAYERPLAAEVGLQAMSNARFGASHLRLGGRSRGLAYEAGGTVKRSGSFDTPQQMVPNTGMEEQNFSARLGSRSRRGSVLAAFEHLDARLGMFEPDEPDVHAERFEIGEPYQRVHHTRAKLEGNVPLSGHRLQLVGTWQQNRRREFGHHHGAHEGDHDDEHEDEHHEDEAPPHEDEDEGPDLYLRLTTATADARFHHRPVGRVFGTFGLSGLFQRNETLAEETLIPAARTVNGAAYVFEELVLDRLTVSGGMRLDVRRIDVDANEALGVEAQTRDYTALTGAVGSAWQPHPAISVAANAGRAWRAPVLIELFADGVHEGTIRYEQGTPSLRPEESTSLDGSLRWVNRHLYVELNGYVNWIDDYIFPRRTSDVDPESGYDVYRYDQASARIWGGELTADFHPHPLDWVHLRLSADLTRTRNLDTRMPLPFSPPPRLQAEVEVERDGVGPFDDVRLRFGPTLVARQDRVAPFETPTPGYDVWNVALSGVARFGWLRISPTIAVDNLFDTGYLAHLSRFRAYEVQEPGRNVRFQLVVAVD